MLVKKNKQNTNQKGISVFGVLFALILSLAFISFFIYVTQPRKKTKYSKNLSELTDYLLVKEKRNKEYDLRDF